MKPSPKPAIHLMKKRSTQVQNAPAKHDQDEHSRLAIEKLKLECAQLRSQLERPSGFWTSLSRNVAVLTMIGGLCTFIFSVWQYKEQQDKNRAEDRRRGEIEKTDRELALRKDEEYRDLELMKVVWEKEVGLLFEASNVAAMIATTSDAEQRSAAEARFWVLYEGPLCIVEIDSVIKAMVNFGNALKAGDEQPKLRSLSNELASACQDAITSGATTRLKSFRKDKADYRDDGEE
jgi:hypothetical protein